MPGHRLFAALYDRVVIAGPERAGLREMRAQLLTEARGRVLELGAGTGLNLAHYGEQVTELVLSEPDPHMAKRLRQRAEAIQIPSEVVETGAERLPFDDHSFDTIVATLVFCTVDNPPTAVSEAARLLKPDGQLLLIEHVRADEGSQRAFWQDRFERPWGWLGAGCHPNRDTAAALEASFDVSALQPGEMPGKAPPIVKPLIRGTARPIAAG
jgi:Methylase involved in ubiquinone/menaquinone biosynthesis